MSALFAAEPARQDVIDEIVSNPTLFAGVQRRIDAARRENDRSTTARPTRTRLLVAYGGMGLAGCVALTAMIASNVEKGQVASQQQVTDRPAVPVTASARSEVPPQPITGKLSADRVETEAPRAEKAVLASRPKRRSEAQQETVPAERFLPVSYTGDPSETAAGGQIIRVEMKRSSLFAMGVDVPLENDDPMVKAELLVSRDGVTRAVRLVD